MYTIDWDDNDPTGREISYENIALDQIPDESLIGIDTLVLFQQGEYCTIVYILFSKIY